ncbi:MAG: glycosidase [Alistipes sp.]
MKLTKYIGNPILSPNLANSWENLVTCNPGVAYDNGTFYMLYRAAGDDAEHVIRLGLATSTDGFNFQRVSDKPAFSPSIDGPDSGCIEDPRIVKLDSEFYITYAYRAYPPGQYWTFQHDVVRLPVCGADAPAAIARNLGNSALAVTSDFQTFHRLGRLTSPLLDDRDVILFPQKIDGQYVMMHRPKEYVGEKYGVQYPSIWLKFSNDLLCWEDKSSQLLLTGREGSWEEKIGGSTPPILTDKGWLMLYHGVARNGHAEYKVGAVLLDPTNPLKVIARTPNPILEPEFPYETEGFYNHCVFPTGNVVVDDVLYVYYGGADRYVGVATCNLTEFLKYLTDECHC